VHWNDFSKKKNLESTSGMLSETNKKLGGGTMRLSQCKIPHLKKKGGTVFNTTPSLKFEKKWKGKLGRRRFGKNTNTTIKKKRNHRHVGDEQREKNGGQPTYGEVLTCAKPS